MGRYEDIIEWTMRFITLFGLVLKGLETVKEFLVKLRDNLEGNGAS